MTRAQSSRVGGSPGPFFELVRRRLAPNGRFLFFDETYIAASVQWEEHLDESTGATFRTRLRAHFFSACAQQAAR